MKRLLGSFHPERVHFRSGYLNHRSCLCGVLVRLRKTPRFPCQHEKSPLSESESSSFPSGVSRWKLGKLSMLVGAALFLQIAFSGVAQARQIYTGIFGLWGWGDWNDALQLVSDNKFDIAVGVSNKTNLDIAQKYGLKCLVDIGLKKEMIVDEVKWNSYLTSLRNVVTQFKDHPAVFAWYVADEPDWQDIPPDKIKIVRDVVKSIDTSKPIFAVLGNSDKWVRYLPYLDIISIDPYLTRSIPGKTDTPEMIRGYIRKMKLDLRKSRLHKPLWLVVGAFEAVPRIPGGISKYVKPTSVQFNQMVDIGIQEGVAGILVYTLASKNNPNFLDWNLPQDDPLLWDAVRSLPRRVKQSSH